jgi:mannitol-1-/sugar-/sorbitol-6-phosphatase
MRSIKCRAILFDMDGTLVDSTKCVEAIWGRWAERHGMPVDEILWASHGRRTLDTLREVAPHLDIAHEAKLLDAEEMEFTEGTTAVQGAAQLLGALPRNSWAVVTSAGRAIARLRLECVGLPVPAVLVTADDVAEGKPSPAGYQMAATRLGVAPDQCLVIEDTPAGILAGRSAGMQVLAVTTTYPVSSLLDAHCVEDFCGTRISVTPAGIELRFA